MINNLFNHLSSSLSNYQRALTPQPYDLDMVEVDAYSYEEKRYTVSKTGTIKVYRCRNLVFNRGITQYPTFISSLNDCFKNRLLNVMYLYIEYADGTVEYVDNNNVMVIKNAKYSYLAIDKTKGAVSKIRCYLFPNSCYGNTKGTTLAWGANNIIIPDTIKYATIDIGPGARNTITAIKRVICNIASFIYNIDNGLKLMDKESATYMGMGTFQNNTTFNIRLKVFYVDNIYECCDILYTEFHETIRDQIQYLIMSNNVNAIFSNVSIDIFNSKLELNSITGVNHDELYGNLELAINQYNRELITDRTSLDYKRKHNMFSIEYSAEWLIRKSQTGMMFLPRLKWLDTNGNEKGYCREMIFVNGKLYSMQNTVYDHNNNTFSFSILGLKATDIVEIIYIAREEDILYDSVTTGSITIPSDNISINDIKIFTKADPLKNEYFANMGDVYEDNAYIDSTADYLIDYDTNNNIIIGNPDSNKISVVSNNIFRYQRFVPTENTVSIQLSNDFKYCQDTSHYMVFINGRRVLSSDIIVIIPANDNPYYTMAIYSDIVINEGDVVDIFYLPFVVDDIFLLNSIYNAISIEDISEEMTVRLNNQDFMVFANGYKVLTSNFKVVSNFILKILQNLDSKFEIVIVQSSNYDLPEEDEIQYSKLEDIMSTIGKSTDMMRYFFFNGDERDTTYTFGTTPIRDRVTKDSIYLTIYQDFYSIHYEGTDMDYTTIMEMLKKQDSSNTYIADNSNAIEYVWPLSYGGE